MTTQCCKCSRVKVEGEWIHPESEASKRVSHTYCPACHAETVRAMKREMAAARGMQPATA